MNLLPKSLVTLIEELGLLPGVGPRTAERYAYYLLRANPAHTARLAEALRVVHDGIGYCPKTFMLIDSSVSVSPLYDSPRRNKRVVAVVEEPLDVIALEKTGQYKGTYHVLGGAISPIDGISPENLHITELIKRIKDDKVTEIILATNASVEGESTALYIQKLVLAKYPKLKITRLARGLPAGTDIGYADQITLSRALEERQAL